jgi:hypothetical protein
VTSPTEDAQMPGVAPIATQGVPNFSALAWWGAFAPAATPAPVLQKVHAELVKALRTPAVAVPIPLRTRARPSSRRVSAENTASRSRRAMDRRTGYATTATTVAPWMPSGRAPARQVWSPLHRHCGPPQRASGHVSMNKK